MRIKYICLVLTTWLFFPDLYCQPDTLTGRIETDILRSEDLVFTTDSSRLRIISAGRISKNLDELPLTVYVVSHEDILKNQYTSLIDVLNSLPGIVTSQPGYGELGESFQIWGLTGNLYSKILINGMPIKPSVVSGMPIGCQLPIRQADKIEVIYGTSSSVYGADAVSGVINIITRNADQGTMVRGDISLGQDGYSYMNFLLGGKAGKNNNILQYNFYGSLSEFKEMDVKYESEKVYNPLNYYQQQGKTFELGGIRYDALQINESLLRQYSIDSDDFTDEYYGPSYSGRVDRPDMEDFPSASHMIGIQMEFRGFGFSYDNMYRRTHSSLGLSPVFYKYNNPQNYWGENIHRIILSHHKDFKRFSSSTQLSNLVYQMDNNSSQGVTFMANTDKAYRYSASNDLQVEQVLSFSPVKNLEIIGGLSYSQSGNLPVTNYLASPFRKKDYRAYSDHVNLTDSILGNFGINPVNFNNISGFVQYFYKLNKFRFLGGLRYDANTLYGNRFSPQLGVLYKTGKKISIHLSVGNAYKAPPSSLVYHSLAYPTENNMIHYSVIPNTKLKPEKFNTIELGLTRPIFKRMMIHQTFFYYRITDHIVPEKFLLDKLAFPLATNDSVKSWVNNTQSVSNVVGSQTTISAIDLVRSVHLNAELSLSFLNRQDRLPNVVDIVKEYLTLMPKHTGKLKISLYPVKNLYVSIESHWMSKWLRVLIPFEDLYNEFFKETDGYYAMNAMASYNLSHELSMFLKVTNMFDEKYGTVNAIIQEENLPYNPQLSRTIRFGFSYKLN